METRVEQPPLPRSTSDQTTTSRKRARDGEVTGPSPFLPSNDRNAWYYPGLPTSEDKDGDEELEPGTAGGNWGKKHHSAARFTRKGHIANWGPGREEYDIEERARKRLKLILPEITGQPQPKDPILPHLRSPSPPLLAPYITPSTHFSSYTQSIFDPNVGHSFRSNLLGSLERSASELIQSEIALNRALGRFWTALGEKADREAKEKRHKALQEQTKILEERKKVDEEARAEIERARMEVENPEGPMTNGIRGESPLQEELEAKRPIFPSLPDSSLVELDTINSRSVSTQIFTLPTDMRFDYQGTNITLQPGHQAELVARSVQSIRELQEDSKECMERLEEIREMLGKVRGLRDAVWSVMRSKAVMEMEAELEE